MEASKTTVWMALMVCVVLLGAGSAHAGLTAEAKCQAGKNKEAGKYAFCMQKAEMKLVKTKGVCSMTTALACYRDAGCPASETCLKDEVKYNGLVAKCNQKYSDKWSQAESKAAGACPTTGDGNAVEEFVGRHSGAVNNALVTGEIPGFIPETGQTQCDQGAGTLGSCPGSPAGQDGDVQWGVERSYTDNGDGTITDEATGLMWEVLCDENPPGATCPTDHDADTLYTWVNAFAKVAAMNSASYAGYNDWRLPNVSELQSLVDYGRINPAIDPAFDANCTPPCAATVCSCTRSGWHWPSTTDQFDPTYAWVVGFYQGYVSRYGKTFNYLVRAVRGGL